MLDDWSASVALEHAMQRDDLRDLTSQHAAQLRAVLGRTAVGNTTKPV